MPQGPAATHIPHQLQSNFSLLAPPTCTQSPTGTPSCQASPTFTHCTSQTGLHTLPCSPQAQAPGFTPCSHYNSAASSGPPTVCGP